MIELLVGTAITTVLAIAAFFFQKWLSEVEEKIAEIKREVRSLRDSSNELLKEVKSTRTQISSDLKELPQVQAMLSKIETLDRVKEFLRNDFLPKMQENQTYFGRIIHLEEKSSDFDSKLLKMFKAVDLLVQKREKQAP